MHLGLGVAAGAAASISPGMHAINSGMQAVRLYLLFVSNNQGQHMLLPTSCTHKATQIIIQVLCGCFSMIMHAQLVECFLTCD